jgi:hypothetical protein
VVVADSPSRPLLLSVRQRPAPLTTARGDFMGQFSRSVCRQRQRLRDILVSPAQGDERCIVYCST